MKLIDQPWCHGALHAMKGWRRTEKKEEENLPEKGYDLRRRKNFWRR